MKKLAAIFCLLMLTSVAQGRHPLSSDKKIQITRDLMAEYGTAKVVIPRSKKPLEIDSKGNYNREVWLDAMDKFGPAAKLGNLVQITKFKFKQKKLVLQLNHGLKGGRRWWHRIRIYGGVSQRQRGTAVGGRGVHAPGGTTISLVFAETFPNIGANEIRRMLGPIIDFRQRSASEIYMDSLPKKFQQAISENIVLPGMDSDMVLLSRGRPNRKVRETHAGVESEDWIYGTPPGNITFITFEDGTVIEVRESYAGVGGEVKTAERVRQ